MRTLVVVLGICLSGAYSASVNQDDGYKDDTQSFVDESSSNSYSVLLSMIKGRHVVKHCGGTRLSREWFITAAECMDQPHADKIMVTFSTHPYENIPVPLELKSVEHVIHPNYDEKRKTNNLALIRCENCGLQNKDELPSIPPKDDKNKPFSQEPAIVTGIIDRANQTPVLPFDVRSVQTKLVHPFWCKFYYFASVGGNHICTSSVGTKGLSPSDVGAPLVIRDKSTGKLEIVGVATSIVPWTIYISMPMVFTRVTSYMEWIREVTNISM